MTALPLVIRELRVASQRASTYASRSWLALAAVLTSLGIITLNLSAGRNPNQIGLALFGALAGIGFVGSLLAGWVLTSDCLSEERRQGTLGLLLLTDLSGYDLVLGKLASTSLAAFCLLLGMVPTLAFFLGGVSLAVFWRTVLVLLVTLGFSLAAGLFVSSISLRGRKALLGTALLVTSVTLLPMAGEWLSRRGSAPTLAGLLLVVPSPTHALLSAATGATSGVVNLAGNLFALGLLSVLLVLLAGYYVGRVAPEGRYANPSRPPASGVGRRLCSLLRKRVRRRPLSDLHPAIWLATRNGLPPLVLGLLWGFAVLGWPVALALRSTEITVESYFFVVIFVAHTLFKGWVAWEVSRDLAEGYRSGALELLLVTPLGERGILAGWLTGFRRRMLGPLALLLTADLLLAIAVADAWLLLALVFAAGMVVADCHALSWVGLWHGLAASTPTKAFFRTVAWVLFSPAVGFLGVLGLVGLLRTSDSWPPSPAVLAVAWFLSGYVADVILCWWADRRLERGFPEVAGRTGAVARPRNRHAAMGLIAKQAAAGKARSLVAAPGARTR